MNNSAVDAQPVLSACLTQAAAGSTIALAPGTYTLKTPLSIDTLPSNLTITTAGVQPAASGCGSTSGPANCATLLADAAIGGGAVMVNINSATGLRMVGVKFDGNGKVRRSQVDPTTFVRDPSSFPYTFNMTTCNQCQFINVGSVNAFWASSFRIAFGNTVTIDKSYFADNGASQTAAQIQSGSTLCFVSDGVTIGGIAGLTVTNSEFRDNTDVHLIFGNSLNAKIQNNKITSSTQYVGAGIYLANWSTSNNNGTDFTGTVVSNNTIQCNGGMCGIGINAGEVIWQNPTVTKIFGAKIESNRVDGALQGIEISGATNIQVNGNDVTGSGGYTMPDGSQHTSGIDVDPRTTDSTVTLQSNIPAVPATSGVGMLSTYKYFELMVPDPYADMPRKGGLAPGEKLANGSGIRSNSAQYTLYNQPDGNLVLYKGINPIWNTSTVGSATGDLSMQSDGNLVLYDVNGTALWNTFTDGNPGAAFAVQDDGNLVIYSVSGSPLWARFH